MIRKTYNELKMLNTLKDRYEYLHLKGVVGETLYGRDRCIMQDFYHSGDWRPIRRQVIIRDNGQELGLEDNPIEGFITVHHICPITLEDVINGDPKIYDLNNLICVSDRMHKAIHYGDWSLLPKPYSGRRPGDTKLW